MAEPRPSATVDLSGIRPKDERVVAIVHDLIASGFERIDIAWGRRFPWSLEPRIVATDAFSETLVCAVSETCSSSGVGLGLIWDRLLPTGFSGYSVYRHLERACRVRREFARWKEALGKLFADLVDDVCALVPSLAAVRIPVPGEDGALSDWCLEEARRLLLSVCADRDISVDVVPWGETSDNPGASVEARLGNPVFGDLSDRSQKWLVDTWRRIGALHARIVSQHDLPTDGLVQARLAVTESIAHGKALIAETETAYRGYADAAAVRNSFRPAMDAILEQYAGLSARVSALRGGR